MFVERKKKKMMMKQEQELPLMMMMKQVQELLVVMVVEKKEDIEILPVCTSTLLKVHLNNIHCHIHLTVSIFSNHPRGLFHLQHMTC